MRSHRRVARSVTGGSEAGDARPPAGQEFGWRGASGEKQGRGCSNPADTGSDAGAVLLHLRGYRRACDDRLGSDGGGAGGEKALEDRQHGCPGDEVGTGTPTVSPGSAAEGWEQLCLLCPFSPCDVLFTLMNTRSACTGKDLSRASSPAVAWQSRASCSLQL